MIIIMNTAILTALIFEIYVWNIDSQNNFYEVSLGLYQNYCLSFVKSMNIKTVLNDYLE